MQLFGVRDSIIRRAALHVFRKINPGDITIKHHWINSTKIKLHSFKHKGYWWHGKKRELNSINKFFKLINPGDTVIEVGGHIGYFTVLYASLVGKEGEVFVFEPGTNNLKYLENNLSEYQNTKIIKKAISDSDGIVEFFMEDLSGQNNSLIKDYHLLNGNIQLSGLKDIKISSTQIESITLDSFINNSNFKKPVSFIKIDIEGAELLALNGAKQLLSSSKPNIMIEITKDNSDVYKLLKSYEYRLYAPEGAEIIDDNVTGNVFCLYSQDSINKFLKS